MYRIYLWLTALIVGCGALIFSACLSQAQPHMPFAIAWNYDTSGYLETCGCSSHQLGGLGRRASKLAELREKQPVLAIEGAHILADKGGFQLFKGQIIVASLNAMQYNALQLGVREAQQGSKGLDELTAKAAYPCFCANLSVDGKAWKTPYAICEVAGNSVGITGVTQPETTKDLEMPAEVSFSDPGPALDRALAELKAQKVDCIVVCLEGNFEWIAQTAQAYRGQADLFLSGNREESTAKLDFQSEPPLLNIWDKGRFMGLLTVDPLLDAAGRPSGWNIAGTSVQLNDQLKDAPEITALLENDYKPKLKDMFFDVFKADLPQLFMPPEYCADCHKKEYQSYLKTGHAQAMATLEKKGQLYNPDCMKCHLTYDSREDKLYSMNCVTCHTNITDDHVWQATADPKSVVKPNPKVTTYQHDWCYRCHDPMNSSNFEGHWPQYVNQVFHGGDKSEAEVAAKAMGINMSDPPPAHE